MNDTYDSPFNTLSYDEQVLSDKLGLTGDREIRDWNRKKTKQGFSGPNADRLSDNQLEDRIRRQIKSYDEDDEDETKTLIKKLKKHGLIAQPANQPVEPVPAPKTREHFVSNRPETATSGFCSSCTSVEMNENKVLIFLLIVIAVVCFVQYLTNQQISQDLKDLMQTLRPPPQMNIMPVAPSPVPV
jgi:hypothetical protein